MAALGTGRGGGGRSRGLPNFRLGGFLQIVKCLAASGASFLTP
jgi:hypothetical protein